MKQHENPLSFPFFQSLLATIAGANPKNLLVDLIQNNLKQPPKHALRTSH